MFNVSALLLDDALLKCVVTEVVCDDSIAKQALPWMPHGLILALLPVYGELKLCERTSGRDLEIWRRDLDSGIQVRLDEDGGGSTERS